MVGDLVMGPDGQEGHAESIADAKTGDSGSHLFGSPLPVVRHHDGLDQYVEFQLLPPLPGRLSDVVDDGVEPLGFPADRVPLAVFEGTTEHRQPDDVGMAGRMSESPLAVDANQQGYVDLPGAKGAYIVQLVVLSAVGHGLAIEEPAEDLYRLGESSLANWSRVEALPDGVILGEGVPRTDPHFEATPAQMVQASQLLGQTDRVVKVIVQNEWADAERGRAVGDRHQGCEGWPTIDDVIPRVHHVKTSSLRGPGLCAQLVCGAGSYLEAKTKPPHE
jgi:hypothetical protein